MLLVACNTNHDMADKFYKSHYVRGYLATYPTIYDDNKQDNVYRKYFEAKLKFVCGCLKETNKEQLMNLKDDLQDEYIGLQEALGHKKAKDISNKASQIMLQKFIKLTDDEVALEVGKLRCFHIVK